MPKVRGVLLRAPIILITVLALMLGAEAISLAAKQQGWTPHDLAFYLSPQQLDFIRPGVVVKVVSANIATDGTITTRIKVTDPKGVPVDKDGIVTPGTISIRFIAAYIPAGKTYFWAYTTTVLRATLPGNTNPPQTQAATDSGGVFTTNAVGDYTYTFKTKAPANFDATATHAIGVYATRDLSEFMEADEWAESSNDVFNFVPNGSPVTVVRNIINTSTCNKCHDPIYGHGGTRLTVEMCDLCHTPQTINPDTLESQDMPVLIHRIHMGKNLPSVLAGKPYRIWHRNNWTDFSDVAFPTDPNNCTMCHEPGTKQADAWLKPSRAACGSCHDDVNFATGANHLNLPQVSDNLCANCHIPQGEIEYDASIKGAHQNASFSRQLPGTTFKIDKVENYGPGQKPRVTFSIKDKAGTVIDAATMNSLSIILAGPTTDYSFYKSETATKATRSGDLWVFELSNAIPADAKGTYTIGLEGYKNFTINAGTVNAVVVRDVGYNQMLNISVDGSTLAPRRIIVSQDKCNSCHGTLMLHGTIRRDVQYCTTCHNPNTTDASVRPADKMPAESINFKTMIHKIHTGAELTRDFTVYGRSSSVNNYNEVGYPGDRRDCSQCHVGTSYQSVPETALPSLSARDYINPTMQPLAASCLSCHTAKSAAAHAALNTSSSLGEACDVCHGPSAEQSIVKSHAR